jgi:Tfp pilus assembly protein PilN
MGVRDINLVPESVLLRRYAERHVAGWTAACGLVIVLLVCAYVVTLQRAAAKGRYTVSEQQVRKRLGGTVAQIESRKQEIEKLSFLREIPRPMGAAQILGQLGDVIDPGTWLTDLALTAERGSDTSVTMQGLSYSNAQLGATINALGSCGAFRDVVLGDASAASLRREGETIPEKMVRFSATARAIAR